MAIEILVNRFQIWDYVVFIAVLVVSAAIGLYYACKGSGQNTTSEFLMGGRQMGIFPIALSLLASFLSAITLLGTPVEIYQHGTQYFMIFVGYCFVIPITAYLYMPVFYNLEITSAYEYLERRFNHIVRKCGSGVYIFQMVIYLAIVTYAPALALNQVTGLHVWGSVAAIAAVCTFYTTVGGMKAVMWTDAFQLFVMFGSMLAVIIKGFIDLGGISEVWHRAELGGRIEFFNFDTNPLVRHTFWSLVIGGGSTWLSTYSGNQAQIQRYLTSPTLRSAQIALWWNLLGLTSLLAICCLAGLLLYARYYDCDPTKYGVLSSSDQMLPLFVMDELGLLTGLPGLFVAGIFSGALSTVSSGLNSLAAVTLEDFIRPYKQNMSERNATILSKVLALSYGVLVFALVAVAEKLGNVLTAALSIFGMIGGPILGLFTLGIFFPWANAWGAVIGLFSSLTFVLWLGIGAQVAKPYYPRLPISTSGCNAAEDFFMNTTFVSSTVLPTLQTTLAPTMQTVNSTPAVYSLSYLYYSAIAIWWVVIVGLLVSFITGKTKMELLNPKVISKYVALIIQKCKLGEVGKDFIELETAKSNGKPTLNTDGKDNKGYEDDIEIGKLNSVTNHMTSF
ncbi:Sodium-coupled monocarboxylate transporter 1 [Chamberlinius hualienensis]